LGALNLESDRINAFSASDLDLLTAFANHAAIAIENARLYEEVLKNKELEFDLMIARRIQKALLPKALPKIKGYDFATLNIPSRTVSGDLYDLAWLNNGKLGIAIGDVSGKGTSAAILMASIYSTYKSILNEPISAAKRMQRLNEVMCDNVLSGTYATLFYSELEPENHKLIYCNAGHFPPIVVSPNGKTKTLTEGGMILGFIKKAPYLQGELELKMNDVLLLYTDGLIEAKNRRGDFFTLEVVTHLIRQNMELSAKALKEKILSEIKHFVQKPQFTDDLTFVVIKVTDSQ